MACGYINRRKNFKGIEQRSGSYRGEGGDPEDVTLKRRKMEEKRDRRGR